LHIVSITEYNFRLVSFIAILQQKLHAIRQLLRKSVKSRVFPVYRDKNSPFSCNFYCMDESESDGIRVQREK